MGTKTLVVESTPVSPLTQTFNPFSATSTGYTLHSTNLYYEPLFFFNILNPNQAPMPMLATAYSCSNGGKTLTLTTRSGVKWSDGKPFSAADVAFTFNLLMKNPALAQTGTPAPTSATATGPNTVVLNVRRSPQYGNLFLIGTQAIVPQHVWQSVSNPATYADANPVGTGPYVLGQVHPAGHPAQGEPDLLEQEPGARARDRSSRPTSATPRPSRRSNPVRSTARATTSPMCRTCSSPRTRRTTRCGSATTRTWPTTTW